MRSKAKAMSTPQKPFRILAEDTGDFWSRTFGANFRRSVIYRLKSDACEGLFTMCRNGTGSKIEYGSKTFHIRSTRRGRSITIHGDSCESAVAVLPIAWFRRFEITDGRSLIILRADAPWTHNFTAFRLSSPVGTAKQTGTWRHSCEFTFDATVSMVTVLISIAIILPCQYSYGGG